MPIVVCLGFGGRDIAWRFHQSMVIESGHPFQCCQFVRFTRFPRGSPMNQLCLAQTVDGLSQRVVAADRRLDARFGQPLAVANADVL